MTDAPLTPEKMEERDMTGPEIEPWMMAAARESQDCASDLVDPECWIADVARIIARHFAGRGKAATHECPILRETEEV